MDKDITLKGDSKVLEDSSTRKVLEDPTKSRVLEDATKSEVLEDDKVDATKVRENTKEDPTKSNILDQTVLEKRKVLEGKTVLTNNQETRVEQKVSSTKYILYVRSNDANSVRAIRSADPNTIHTVDVSQLQEMPHWLGGVPTAVDVLTGRVFEGTNCLGILTAR